jgi:hypothetical protein
MIPLRRIFIICIIISKEIYERRLIMDKDTFKLENELSRITRDANNIMLLSLISIITLPLYLIALVYFIILPDGMAGGIEAISIQKQLTV